MALQHAGLKRSYDDMRGAQHESREPTPIHQQSISRESTPHSSSNTTAWDSIASGTKSTTLRRAPREAAWDPNASIVLVGVRGTGKSSLAVIAATAYNFRIVELDRAFLDATGQSSATYRLSHGTQAYRRRHYEILGQTLETYPKAAVVVCSFSDLENDGLSLLRHYAQSHPVIHVTRDAEGVQKYFKAWEFDRVNELLLASGPLMRSCSNYEFYNLTERPSEAQQSNESINLRDRDLPGRYLALKRVERDFLRLLRNIIGDHGRGMAHHSAYPLSQTGVEDRTHTFAVRVHVSNVIDKDIDLEVAQVGADCIELVVPVVGANSSKALEEVSRAYAIVRRNSILPVLLTTENSSIDNTDRSASVFETTRDCLSLGPELCSANLTMNNTHFEQILANRGATRIIATWEFPDRPAQGWRDPKCAEAYSRGARLNTSLVKITMPAESAESSLEVNAFRALARSSHSAARLIAHEEGAGGRPSKCFNEILTSVQPPDASWNASSARIPDRSSMTAKAITEALFATCISEPLRFYVYGRDVGYSLAPAMGNAAFNACGMPHEHTTLSSDRLEDLTQLSGGQDFGGAAIVQPFKTDVLGILDCVSANARAIGAVNTVIPIRERRADGTVPDDIEIMRQRNRQGALLGLYGTNTDWIGIRSCVRRGLSPANSVRPNSSGLVCGAGGMARAAVYSLLSLGCRNIYICNRTPERAQELADHYNRLIGNGGIPELAPDSATHTRIQVIQNFSDSWPRHIRPPTMVVCCIPADNADGSHIDFELPPAWLKSPTGGVVVEVAYKRAFTPLIRQIRALEQEGWVVLDGFEFLPEQFYPQYELFTGRRAPRKLMRQQMLEHYNAIIASEDGGKSG